MNFSSSKITLSGNTMGYLGPLFSFSHQAGQLVIEKLKTRNIKLQPRSSFSMLIQGLQNYSLNSIILPIENSLAGLVAPNYDYLASHSVWIKYEIYLDIDLVLASPQFTDLKKIKTIYSHPKALEQCRCFLESLDDVELIETKSTSSSILDLQKNTEGTEALILSGKSANQLGLKIIKKNIADHLRNWTRFFVLEKVKDNTQKFRDFKILKNDKPKVSLCFNLEKNQPGSLQKVLEIFAQKNINLLNISTRPIPGKFFEYTFFLDFELQKLLKLEFLELWNIFQTSTKNSKILGIYNNLIN